jgi:histone H3/H4
MDILKENNEISYNYDNYDNYDKHDIENTDTENISFISDERDENDDLEENKFKKKKISRNKKEKKHYFEHYIRQILKTVCPNKDITNDAKYQLNQLCLIICKILCSKIKNILISINKKTVTEIELEASIKLTFSGELKQKCIEQGIKSINNFTNYNKDNKDNKDNKNKKISRNSKADLIISPSIIQQVLKKNGMHISPNVPVFLAGTIEYFISQILITSDNASDHKKIRITINDMENGLKIDKELNTLLTKNNIHFFNSGTNSSFIHPETIKKTGEKDKKTIKLITKLQESTNHIIPKLFFEQKFKSYLSLTHPDIRFQKDCFFSIQDYIEKWIIEILKYANMITIYSKKSRVTSNDVELVLSIMEKKHPSFLNLINKEETENLEILEILDIEEL